MYQEIFKAVGLEVNEEQLATLQKELPKHFKPAAEFNQANEERRQYKQQYEALNQELEKLKQQLTGQEALQQQVQALQTEIQGKEQELRQTAFTYRLREVLRDSYKVKDPEDILPRLQLDSIDRADLSGLAEQIKPLQESKGYLFAEATPAKLGQHITGPATEGKPNMNEIIRNAR